MDATQLFILLVVVAILAVVLGVGFFDSQAAQKRQQQQHRSQMQEMMDTIKAMQEQLRAEQERHQKELEEREKAIKQARNRGRWTRITFTLIFTALVRWITGEPILTGLAMVMVYHLIGGSEDGGGNHSMHS